MFKLSFAKSLFSSSKRTKNGRAKKRVSSASASAKKRSLMSETALMKDPFALNPPSSPAEEVKPSPLTTLAYQQCTCTSLCLCSPSPPPSSSDSSSTTTKIKRIPPPPIHAPPLPPPSSPITLAPSSFSTPPVSVSLPSSFLSPSSGSGVSTARRPTTATGGSMTPTVRRPLPRPPSAGSPSLSASTPPGSPPLNLIRSAGAGGGGGGAFRLPYGPNTTNSTTPTNNATWSSPKLPSASSTVLDSTPEPEAGVSEAPVIFSTEGAKSTLTRKPTPVNQSRSATTTTRAHSKHNRDRSLSQSHMHSSTGPLHPPGFASSTSTQKFHRATLSPPPPIPLPSPPPSPPNLSVRKRSVAGTHSRSDSHSQRHAPVLPAPATTLPSSNTTHPTGGGRTSLISGARPNPARQSTSSGPSTNTNTNTNTNTTNSEMPSTVLHLQPLRRPSVASNTITTVSPPSPPTPQVQPTRQSTITMTATTARGGEGAGTPSVRVSVRPLPRVPSTCSTIMVAGSVPA